MKGLRTQVSLLLANGHPNAASYPIGRVWLESEIVTDRINKHIADNALMTQLAVSTILSESAGETFHDRIKDLTNGW